MVAPKVDASKGATRDSLRRHNLSTVLRLVHRDGAQSRSTLTSATGLNRSTIGALVAELVDLGLVEEGEPESTGSAGRPSPLVHPSTDHVVVAAIDIASQWLTVGIGGLGGVLVHRLHREVPNDDRSYEATLAEVVAMLHDAFDQLTSQQRVFAVGVAAPGVVRSHDGFVHVAPNLGWRDVALGEDLADALGAELDVLVANEAHLGAQAEHLRGAGVGVDDLVYLSSEVGVGGGAIIDGRLHVGADGYSGEIGHIPTTTGPDALPCRCGATGCLEAETGELALIRLAGRETGGNVTAIVHDIIAAAGDGDDTARRALHEIGVRLGRGVAGPVNMLNPQRIVLGGYFTEAFELLQPGVQEGLTAHGLRPHVGRLTILPADLGDTSALLGAVEYALEPLLDDPARSPAGPLVTTSG